MIIIIIKAIDINNIIHIIDEYYHLIIIQEVGSILIHIISSYSLTVKLNKQREKKNLIKTEVHSIYRLKPIPDTINTLKSISLVIK